MKIDLTPQMPIGDAARRWPALFPVFERFRLDYCCRGRQSFEEACRHAGVAMPQVLQAILELCPAPADDTDWSTAPMSALCDHIVSTHHARTRDALAQLDAMLPRVVAAHGARHPELADLGAIVRELRDELLDHMVREERVLFPWFCRLETPAAVTIGPPWSVKRPIDCMLHDHDSVASAFSKLRGLTHDYTPPPDGCATYHAMLECLRELETDTHVHIHKENNILFPAGIAAESGGGPSRRQTPGPAHTPGLEPSPH